MRNNLIKNNNYFKYPKLVLSDGHILEPGMCTIKWIKYLCHKNRDELLSSVRVNKNTFNPDSLSKQKVQPALGSFSTELIKALRMEHGEQAKGTCIFLETFNKYIMQPLTIADPNKVFLVPEAKPFFSSSDKRLDCIKEIGDWVQQSWYSCVENNPTTVNAINMANAEHENDNDEEKEVSFMKIKFHMKVLTRFL